MTVHRISQMLLDEELKQLISASTKIFPITQEMVDNNLNPDDYEYGRVENHIYRWVDGEWKYIIADDQDITWDDVKFKPLEFPPSSHTHTELHTHSNKSVLDTITQGLVDTWNTVSSKAGQLYVDNALAGKSDINHNHDARYHDKEYVDGALAGKSPIEHNHDGAYYRKADVDDKLSNKSNIGHTHPYSPIDHNHDTLYAVKAIEGEVADHENRLYLIENGYTEGHTHPNLALLNSITQLMMDHWDAAYQHTLDNDIHVTQVDKDRWDTVDNKAPMVHNHDDLYYVKSYVDTALAGKSDVGHTHSDKADKTYVDTALAAKAESTTVNGHTGNTIIHVSQEDKDRWDSGGGSEITISPTKPDGGLWYKIVG